MTTISEAAELAARAALIGVGATAFLDLFNIVQKRVFAAPTTDWSLVGRWVGHFGNGVFVHRSIGEAAPIAGERALGWTAHYVVGVTFAMLLVLICGLDWTRQPTFWPALIVGVASVVAPYLVLQPGMGLGIAASKAPDPGLARLRSLIAHTVFGIGLYLAALAVAAALPH